MQYDYFNISIMSVRGKNRLFHSWVHISLLKIVEINEIKLMKLHVLHNLIYMIGVSNHLLPYQITFIAYQITFSGR